MKKRMILALVLLMAGFQFANARPAYPGKIVYTQPDGKRIVLQRHGDEFGHWTTNAAGRMVRKDADGFYREVSESEASEVRRNAAARRSEARQASAARAGAPAVKGERHFLVILVEFSDLPFTTCEDPKAAFDAQLNEPGYSMFGGTGSARDYYVENSNGVFDPHFDVYGPVTLPNDKYYYGGNDRFGDDLNVPQAIIDGCKLLDDEIDFTQYDSDGDGTVDMVFMYYAGYGEADSDDEDSIWPNKSSLSNHGRSLTLDGVKINTYACSNEKNGADYYVHYPDMMCGIGAICHEFGHVLGLPDTYDTDYSTNEYAGGLYFYSLMCDGTYNNEGCTPPYLCFEERRILGWVTESDYLEFDETGDYTIAPINTNTVYRTNTDVKGEYFLYENRVKSGWDLYIPEEGMIVYHVDRSSNKVGYTTADYLWANTNAINRYGSHPCYYIVPAADQSSLLYYDISEDDYFIRKPGFAFPYKSINSYLPISWHNVEGTVRFRNISYQNNMVTLRAILQAGEVDYVAIADAGSYRAGERFSFELVSPEWGDAPASVVWYYDDEPAGADSVTLTAGNHTVEARLTNADGSKSVLTLEIVAK